MSQNHYLPLTPGLFSVLVILVAGLLILMQLGVLRYAYPQLGISSRMAAVLAGRHYAAEGPTPGPPSPRGARWSSGR